MDNTNVIHRLSMEAYTSLERNLLANIIVSDKTTDLQAGYMLGIQEVLRKLRTGFTIDT